MKKVFFLVNNLGEFNFSELIKKYLDDVSVTVGESLPEHTEEYDLIVLWNYLNIIPNISDKKNIIIFHSSDLPEGKGWAPIYFTLSKGKEFFVISGILAGEGVDTGDIIVKATFKIKDNYTAEFIRKCDSGISIMLTKEILMRFEGRELKGMKQTSEGSYYPRRRPEDNKVAMDSSLNDIFNHLRGCEKRHPAFFYFNQTKYLISIEPEVKPEFPEDLLITYFDN
jgi:methionyl-tRNA formyltransferase